MSAVLWALGAGAVGTLVMALWAVYERGGRIGAEKDLRLMSAQAADAVRQYQEEKQRHAESVKRLEGSVAYLNSELREVDDQLLRCNGIVRSPRGSTAGGASVSGLSWADAASSTGKPGNGE